MFFLTKRLGVHIVLPVSTRSLDPITLPISALGKSSNANPMVMSKYFTRFALNSPWLGNLRTLPRTPGLVIFQDIFLVLVSVHSTTSQPTPALGPYASSDFWGGRVHWEGGLVGWLVNSRHEECYCCGSWQHEKIFCPFAPWRLKLGLSNLHQIESI